jgi:hypothetical protein
MSRYPALNATNAMINSGALPKVALRSPPTASPVREAICSVECTIMLAIGTIASAAEKNNSGARTSARSRARVIGMKMSSQYNDGFMARDTARPSDP